MDHAIVVDGISKRFRRYHKDRPSTLQEAVLRGLRRLAPAEELYALRDLSFTVAPGEMIGVIGRNGAGKSTLLRLLGGVGRPDSGRIQVNGRIGALLDLGAGFHPDLTGRENVYISGVISGLTRRQVTERFDSIVAFSELEDFIDSPLRTYSSGMQMRLAFAVAIHIEADVLLIDEVLAVGDAGFQRKCLERIRQFTEEGRTGILVSHDLTTVAELCDQVLWLQKGQCMVQGPAGMIIEQYLTQVRNVTLQLTPASHPILYTSNGTKLEANVNRFGSFEVEIRDVCFRNARGIPVKQINSGDALQVEITYTTPRLTASPIFDISIVNQDKVTCFKTDTATAGVTLPPVDGTGSLLLHIERLDLAAGDYHVNIGAYEHEWAYAYDYQRHPSTLTIVAPVAGTNSGILSVPSYWQVKEQWPSLQTVEPMERHQPHHAQ
jgi:lipopolysaccharide transport system ATP-binding protein